MWTKNWFLGLGLLTPFSNVFSKDAFVYKQGGMDSGGGHSVVCRDGLGQIVSAELYDYFEATKLRHLELVFPEGSLAAKVSSLLDRIPKTDKDRHYRYKGEASAFLDGSSKVAFVRGARLPYFDDANGVLLPPPGCAIEQLAIQRYPEISGDPEFVINGDIWDRMPDNDRAGLILHEIIYRDAREEKATNSQRARYFNSLLATNRWSVPKEGDEHSDELYGWDLYVSDLTEALLPKPYILYSKTHYAKLDLSSTSFYDAERTRVERARFYIPFTNEVNLPFVTVSLRACNSLNFPSGDIYAQITYLSEVHFYENGCVGFFATDFDGIKSFPKMSVRTPAIEETKEVKFSAVSMDPKGHVSCVVLAEDAMLYTLPGQLKTFEKSLAVHFDDKGYAVERGRVCGDFESGL